jgi:hypothetical protein
MAKLAHGLSYQDPARLLLLGRTIEGFVEDTDVVAVNGADEQYAPSKLIRVLQTHTQHWEKLLFASGGKLELTICFFYLLYWQFLADRVPSLMPIAQKNCSEYHKILGVMKAPNRSQIGEIIRLIANCGTHATAILSNSVTS